MDGRREYAERAAGLLSSAKDRARRAAEEGTQRLSQMRAKAQGLVASAGGACVGTHGAGRHSAGSEEEKTVRLIALGFTQPAARHALRRCGGDLESAAAWLLDDSNADERLAAEAQAGEDSPEQVPSAPFMAPSALRPAGSEFAALSALRPRGRDLDGAAPEASAPAASDEALLRARLRELLPDDGPGLEECLAALPREELQEVAACLEADAAERQSRGAPPGAGRGAGGAAPVGAGGGAPGARGASPFGARPSAPLSARGAAPGWRGAQDGEEFFIRLESAGRTPPGLVLDPRTLAVLDIVPGSLAAEWNAGNPDCMVWLSDTVWEVNGISDPEQIASRLGRTPGAGEALMVGLRRPRAPEAVAAFRGSCSPASGADFLLPQALRSQLAPAGAGPLRQWVPPVARAGGSRRGSGAGLEEDATDCSATAHFGRVDAEELSQRLRKEGQRPDLGAAEDSAAALLGTVGQLLPEQAFPTLGSDLAAPAPHSEEPVQRRPSAAEAEPEAEETLADAALLAEAPPREVQERAEPEAAAVAATVSAEGQAAAPDVEERAEPEAPPGEAVEQTEGRAAVLRAEERIEPEAPPREAVEQTEGPAAALRAEERAEPEAAPDQAAEQTEGRAAALRAEESPAHVDAAAAAVEVPTEAAAPAAAAPAPVPAEEDSAGTVARAASAPEEAVVSSPEGKPGQAEASLEDVVMEELT